MLLLQESSGDGYQSDAHEIGTIINELTRRGIRHHLFLNALAFKPAPTLEQQLLFPGLKDRQLSAAGAVTLPGLMLT
jgi:hypothetical protein